MKYNEDDLTQTDFRVDKVIDWNACVCEKVQTKFADLGGSSVYKIHCSRLVFSLVLAV